MKLGMYRPLNVMDLVLTRSRHLLSLVLEMEHKTPLFRSPIGDNPTHILDIGTGSGVWAMFVVYPIRPAATH